MTSESVAAFLDDTDDDIDEETLLKLSSIEKTGQIHENAAPSSTKKKRKKVHLHEEVTDETVKSLMEEIDKQYGHSIANPDAPPLQTLRKGYLTVSDFSSIAWCEQQYVYSRKMPRHVKKEKMPPQPCVEIGHTMHRTRELEIQSYVKVKTQSAEDSFAIPFINTLGFIRKLLSGKKSVVREVSVYGKVSGVPMLGIVDELRSCIEGGTLVVDLVEFKTRGVKKLPMKTQMKTQQLQVMLYKKLFDDMIKGANIDEEISNIFDLDFGKFFGDEVVKSVERSSPRTGDPLTDGDGWNLQRLFDELRLTLTGMPTVRQCLISYTWQESSEEFEVVQVSYEEDWLMSQVDHILLFWKGRRGCEGVPIEEAHKCNHCHYQDNCAWVKSQTERLVSENRAKKNKTS